MQMNRYINVQTGTAIEVPSTVIAPQWEEVTEGGSKLCDSKRHNCNREKSDGGGADFCGDSDSDSIV